MRHISVSVCGDVSSGLTVNAALPAYSVRGELVEPLASMLLPFDKLRANGCMLCGVKQ